MALNANIAQLASLAQSQIPLHEINYHEDDDSAPGSKRKADDGQQGSQKARRSRYISLACNECKRRKIKCNGQTPCHRCGNLNLECVYAPNCCNGFKDTQEYKDLSLHVISLQDQVNALYENINALRAQLGHSVSVPQQPPLVQQQPQYGQLTSIDPSLQPQEYSQSAYMSAEEAARPSSQRQSFRGLTSADFNFGVAKNTLQVMGINTGGDEQADPAATDDEYPGTREAPRGIGQLLETVHNDKDPIWSFEQPEAERLCRIYDDEMTLMYPLVDVEKTITYTKRLFHFLKAMHKSGLYQQGLPGADTVEDEDTNILKLVLATALIIEGSGRSELGQRLFERVQPAIDNLLLGNVSIKGIRLLVMTAVYEFQRDNEGTSWRLIGLAARLCIELGLHRRSTYDGIADESERNETMLLFWACYVLDRRWSLGTGMPFALQEADLDPQLPRPGDRSPYLTAMIKYGEIGGRVWRMLAAPPSADNGGISPINVEEMGKLEYQVLQWQRGVPQELHFEHPNQRAHRGSTAPASNAGLRSQVVIYLRANQMRILILRPVLHSAISITSHQEHAQKIIDIAKDTIRVLTWVNEQTDLYRKQQVVFHAYLTSALAVLFLSVSHTPAFFAENVRDEFYEAINLVRALSKGSFVSRRLWRTIKSLKEVAPKLGLPYEMQKSVDAAGGQGNAMDPSRSAAVAMAGLAGHAVDEASLYPQEGQASWASDAGASSNPDNMANDLTYMFEVAGGMYGEDADQSGLPQATRIALAAGAEQPQTSTTIGVAIGEDGLSNVMRELF